MSVIRKDLGMVTAYAYAVSKGYTGTEEQFATLMASYADVGQTAVDAALAAKASEDAAKASETASAASQAAAATSAWNAQTAAGNASQAAQTATTKASEAAQSATQAAGSATTASTKAGEAAQSATAAAGSATTAGTAATNAQAAQTAAEAAQTAAETAQGAAEDAAESVSASAAQIAQNTADISSVKSDLNINLAEFETDSNNKWVNTYGTINGVTFTPNGKGGYKIVGTATADGALRYTFEDPITLNGYRLQFKQSKNESDKMLIRCRNASYVIVRNLPANGLSGFSVDSAMTTIKYLDIAVLSGAVLDTELYISLAETTAESVLYPRKIVNAYYSKYADFIGDPTIDIDFWGDSLTRGYGGGGRTFPNTCATIMGASYRNLGHGGESANTIAAREGGNAWIIPAGAVNGDYTLADMNDVFGGKVTPLRQIIGDATATTIYVNGIACNLTRKSQTSPASDDVIYTVSGYTGSALTVPTPCRFIGGDYEAKVTVFFVGTNGQTVGDDTDVNARITIIDSMIAHLKHKNYIVMGLSNGNDANRNADDEAMLAHYGNNFFPTRRELVDNGLTIKGITPTANDLVYINAGTVPESLRIDATHLNAEGYNALGQLLAYKMFSLGFDKIIAKN